MDAILQNWYPGVPVNWANGRTEKIVNVFSTKLYAKWWHSSILLSREFDVAMYWRNWRRERQSAQYLHLCINLKRMVNGNDFIYAYLLFIVLLIHWHSLLFCVTWKVEHFLLVWQHIRNTVVNILNYVLLRRSTIIVCRQTTSPVKYFN